jgi:hypothetical protein
MPKLNNFLIILIILAVLLLVGFSAYEIFLKPSEAVPSAPIQPVNSYFGEDVLEFIKK